MNRVQRYLLHVTVMALLLPMVLHADFYVIPVVKNIKNVVTVAKSGGKFDDPIAAIEWIGDATAENPYVVLIAPGSYTLKKKMQLKRYVYLVGSGRAETKLIGDTTQYSYTSNVLIGGNNNAGLRALSIELTGDQISEATAIENGNTSPVIHDVAIKVSGANWSYGIKNSNSSALISDVFIDVSAYGEESTGIVNSGGEPRILNSEIKMSGFGNAIGIDTKSGATVLLEGVRIEISGAGAARYGVRNEASSLTMRGLNINVQGGAYATGIYNLTGGTYSIERCDISVGAATHTNYGIHNDKTQSRIRHSSVIVGGTAEKALLSENSGAVRAAHSVLEGGVSGDNLCVLCSDDSLVALNANCTAL